MSADVQELLSSANIRLLNGDRHEFEKLATIAEEKYRKDRRLYVTVREVLDAKRAG